LPHKLKSEGKRLQEERTLIEGEDFYREGAFVVFTARYHLRRGYCCEGGCRHCPYRGGAGDTTGDEEKAVGEAVE
jgi:hypothetical protein